PSVNSVETLQNAIDVIEDDGDEPLVLIVNKKDGAKIRLDANQNYIQGSELGADRLTRGVKGEVLGVQIVHSNKVEEGEFYLIKQGALALIVKRDVDVEEERIASKKATGLYADAHYAA